MHLVFIVDDCHVRLSIYHEFACQWICMQTAQANKRHMSGLLSKQLVSRTPAREFLRAAPSMHMLPRHTP